MTEARNLPAMNRDGKTSDPYVRVFVVAADGKKSEVLQCPRINNTVNPQSFAEFMFAVHNDEGAKLEVQLFDHVTFGYDKQLAALSLPVQELPHGPERRTFAFAQGEADLFISYTRCSLSPTVKPAQVLSPLRFVSERSNYYAGELVQAVLTYCVSGAPIDIYGVLLEAMWYVRYHTTSESTNTDSEGRTTTSTNHHYENREMFSHKVVCIGKHKDTKERMTLQPGRYVWPLQLWLPPQAPPSAQVSGFHAGISVLCAHGEGADSGSTEEGREVRAAAESVAALRASVAVSGGDADEVCL